MITVTGSILDADDKPLHVNVTFTPTQPNFPYVKSGGAVLTLKPVVIRPNPNDGSFSVDLEPGPYAVTIATSPQTNLSIVVPSSGGPYTIDQLAGLPVPSPTYTPSGNGQPEGVVTATPGLTYTDVVGGAFYVKLTGTGNTGWQKLIQL